MKTLQIDDLDTEIGPAGATDAVGGGYCAAVLLVVKMIFRVRS